MTAPAGHNSKLTENERKALFFHHMRKRMAHNHDLAEINSVKKADGKTAQAERVLIYKQLENILDEPDKRLEL